MCPGAGEEKCCRERGASVGSAGLFNIYPTDLESMPRSLDSATRDKRMRGAVTIVPLHHA